jgi:heptosyltransferase-2
LSIEKTIDLVGRIRDDLGAVALILGGEEEKERNAIIAEETGMPAARVQTLRGFAAVINQCDKVVSSDSLAMHFAIALAKRLVVFFGPTSPTEIELYGLGYKVFPKMDCLVCYKKVCDRQPSCMDLLSIDELFEALKRV